ncbi:DUF3426 domain-containing protein [Proteobacteria bacterium 005FR1]|nr:DUF3426 domain-containing protein [Proteobacteria bacterium 005FR1]
MIAAPDWEQSPAEEDFDSEEENENRLRFDQAAIDEDDDSAAGLGTEDILISDEMTLEDETFADTGTSPAADFGDENFLALDSWKTTETSLFDRGPRTPKRSDDYDEDFDPDESWAMDLLEEEEEGEELSTAPASQPQALQAQSPVSDDREPVPEETDEHEDYFDYTPEKTGSFTAIAEESGYVPQPEQAREQQSPIWDDEADYSDEEEQPPLHARDDSDPDYDLFESRTSLLNRIEPEPVEFAIAQSRDWRKTLLWGSLSLAGMLMLIGQVAWLQFDQLSRQQPYRDLYAAVCPLIGCKLPSLAAPDLIRTSNLVVRSHPQAEGALMVDTILLNRASFEQPFPDLVLTFSNIHGQTLAARRFTPSEYLAGELAGQTRMPSNQPIHLSLEIVDPGPDAVNYSAYIPQ